MLAAAAACQAAVCEAPLQRELLQRKVRSSRLADRGKHRLGETRWRREPSARSQAGARGSRPRRREPSAGGAGAVA